MCGIVGIVGKNPVAHRLVDGLKRLEYRGYDSAGLSTVLKDALHRRRAPGKLIHLESLLKDNPLEGTTGIGHTRWATHGAPTEANTHPHCSDQVSLVHNGIIENHRLLRNELIKNHGVVFQSETDTEVIVHLVTTYLKKGHDPQEAVSLACARLQGAYAIAVIFAQDPHLMIATRHGSPLAVGYGDGEMYVGSDALALSPLTNKIFYLEEGDLVILRPTAVEVYDSQGHVVERKVKENNLFNAAISKEGYRHFMAKEIHEQPDVIGHNLSRYLDQLKNGTLLKAFPNPPTVSKITLVACGTAFYAAWVAKYWFEHIARIPVDIDIASEFRYRMPPLPEGGLALFVSQSGETADTLAALRYAKTQGQTCVGLVNVEESSLDREAHISLYTHAGREIGVASTKAFTTQLTTLAMLCLAFAQGRQTLCPQAFDGYVSALSQCPELMSSALDLKKDLKIVAERLSRQRDVLFLGRGWLYPLALEGALKLKEISYIHAEGYAAGELKHGPIALIDPQVPSVVLAPSGDLLDKTLSNVKEVLARKGPLILISDQAGHDALEEDDTAVTRLVMPSMDPFITPIIYAIPLQLLAYYTATAKGTDVDQPRNLAKSVTVE